MARKPKLYQKLARRRGGIGSHFSLWLASDHILQVESNLMTETYQRVWLRDVQGLFIRPSRVAKWVSGIALVFVLLFGLMMLGGGEMVPVFGVFAGLAGLVLLYGIFFARNCHTYAVTAVQRAEWGNVARRRQARKLIARLEPLIREAQAVEDAPPPVFASAPEPRTDVSTSS